jgi:hypothetical protein
MTDKGHSEDYIFRYPLQLESASNAIYPNAVTEMIRAQLQSLLNLVVPVAGGKEVKVDGFKLLRDRDKVYDIFVKNYDGDRSVTHPPDPLPLSQARGEGGVEVREGDKRGEVDKRLRDQDQAPGAHGEASLLEQTGYQDVKNAALYEPRIELIKAELESLMSVVNLEKEGKVVAVDGFRLKNLRDWLVPSAGDPIEVFGYAGTRCDADCIFCYNNGNPSSLSLGVLRRSRAEEWDEIMTRLRYFSPEGGLGLFPSLGSIYEVLNHPRIFEILRRLREKTPAVFRIAINGTRLTPRTISRLDSLLPVYLYLSLNSASPLRRRKLMKDKNPQVAIDALPLLREKGIPYATVIVPWPSDSLVETLEDLERTVAYADKHDSHLIQINLPGYSRYLSSEKLYDLNQVWSATVARVRELRKGTSAPIVVMPSLFEENLYEEHKNRPEIIGLVKNSPAARAGLEKGDEIIKVNGLIVSRRPQARDILATLQQSKMVSAEITVKREGQLLDLSVNQRDFAYPYSENVDRHLGIVMMGTGFRVSYLEKLREVIDGYQAKHILFLSSALVRPSFEQALAESPLFASGHLTIDIRVPRNNFFGGNIFMGDLLVVQDFIDCIREYLEKDGKRPDLVVIPSSPFNLGAWRRDLTGRAYLDIEREVGIPVELLDCATVYD